jgi:hypothetical protein
MNKRHKQCADDAAKQGFDADSMLAFAALSQLQAESHSPPQASSSSSPAGEAALELAQSFFTKSPSAVCEAAAAAEQGEEQADVTVVCETFTCGGGTWFGGSSFEPCKKRKQTDGIRHTQSVVCTIHHTYVKCISCPAHVHEGCHAPCATGYSLPQRNVPWKCLQCTLQHRASALDTKVGVLKPEGGASEGDAPKEKATSKCLFETRADLQHHMRRMNWKFRSTKPGTATCICGLNPNLYTPCAVKFHVKCKTKDSDGMWIAINMPSEHNCVGGGNRGPTPVTSRVCNLPVHVYKEIQNLACCKAFKPANIQVYINQKYGTIVDTTLIYNIGYRARSKLGIGDMEKLYTQQKVRVYTFQPFQPLQPNSVAGPTRRRRHV